MARLQSAMEYLSTYGWSVLVIGVVLVALFEFGIFGSSGISPSSSCLANAGFLCSKPILTSSGILNITFGQSSGQTYNVSAVGCSNSTAAPSNFINIQHVTLRQGGTTKMNFMCPLTQNSLGSSFSGTLWIQYEASSSTIFEAKVATLETKVSTSAVLPGSTISSALLSVPITLVNSQSSNTQTPFQQLLTINSNNYAQFISPNWQNVEFTTGNLSAGSPGNTLQAWVESNPINTATSTPVWINLPSGVSNTANTVIYMDIMTSNFMSASGPTGEEADLSPTFGQYDNGASVFLYYNNGQTLPSFNSAGSYSAQLSAQSNPFGVTTNTVKVTMTLYYPVWITTPLSTGNVILEGWENGADGDIGYFLRGSNSISNGYLGSMWNGPGVRIYLYQGATSVLFADTGSTYNNWAWNQFIAAGSTLTDNVYTGGPPESGGSLLTTSSATNSLMDPTNMYIGYGGWNAGNNWYTTRARSYPPSGVMPSATYGAA